MSRVCRFALTLAVLMAAASPRAAAAASLIIDNNGILTGATGVQVGGNSYDLTFLDGSCVTLFSGCDEASDFEFVVEADAVAASQALLDEVFRAQFDANPALTRGCGPIGNCFVFTPYEVTPGGGVNIGMALNSVDENGDIASAGFFGASFDVSGDENKTFAVWRRAAVPEPASVLLFGTGAALLVVRRRHGRSRVE